MTNLPHLAQRLFNVPLAITPGKLEVVIAALADRFGVTSLFRGGQPVAWFDDGDDWVSDEEQERRARDRGYDTVAGVAVIPVTGTLVAKLNSVRPYCGMTGYDSIRAAYSYALADEAVKGIVFDCDSPGGEVAGCFDLVDDIFQARDEKPTIAILSEHAYSACFALASACEQLSVPRTGGTGSVGVICACVDMSRALDKAGVSVELITFGERKADGNEFSPLTKEARQRFQSDVDIMGELFVETVARNRGIAASKVRATQAGTFMGAAGVEVGFADQVLSPRAAFRAFVESIT